MSTSLFFGIVAAVVFILILRASAGPRISGADARQKVASGALLLDVRTPGEFASGHIKGAMNIPVQELGSRFGEVGATDRPVVVYCASGMRSARAAAMLRAKGWAEVYNLGPQSAW